MVKFKFMIGVLEGYGHENEGITPERALELGKAVASTAMSERITKVGGKSVKESQIKNLKVSLASAVYAREENFGGCPKSGEIGVIVEGECEESALEGLETRVKYMMKQLGQNTVTIEKELDGVPSKSTYISKGGEKVEYFDPKTEPVETFIAKLKTAKMTEVGEQMQKVYSEVSIPSGKYIISGILTVRNGHVEFSATQNPTYGQTDAKQYRLEAVELVKTVAQELGIPAQVEFKDAIVAIEKTITLAGVKKQLQRSKTETGK